MYRYIIKRVLLVIPTLLGAAALVFVLMRLIPGDVCVVRLGSGGNTLDPKAIALCHAGLTEAERAVGNQESVLQELMRTEEPTAEAAALLEDLRRKVARAVAERY